MRTMFWAILLAVAAGGTERVALIEFFGYQGMDVEAVRKALPVHEGDAYSESLKTEVRAAVKRVAGREATDVDGICCDPQGDRVLFIGLPGQSSRTFHLNPSPAGPARLSLRIVELYNRMEKAEREAVFKGRAQEDTGRGYRLIKYPPARALELQFRKYALQHEAELRKVLAESADAEQRAIAADGLGYARRSRRQTAALVEACRDPDSDVRNNATRALGEMLGPDSTAAREVPPEVFLDMVSSGVWTDRNKATFVLEGLSRSSDTGLREQIKAKAGVPLMEMANWRDTGHAWPARMILGRVAGVPEEQLMKAASGTPEEFAAAMKR